MDLGIDNINFEVIYKFSSGYLLMFFFKDGMVMMMILWYSFVY